jgi:hypothetical protein
MELAKWRMTDSAVNYQAELSSERSSIAQPAVPAGLSHPVPAIKRTYQASERADNSVRVDRTRTERTFSNESVK